MVEELTAEMIRRCRVGSGLTIAEAARELRSRAPESAPALDSLVRAWKRWEAGTTKPSRRSGVLLRGLLLELSQGAAVPASVVLGGDWWASWQTWRDGQERFSPQRVGIRQAGNDVRWWATTRGVPVNNGGYLWSGELRVFDNSILMGWYTAEDGSVLSKGSVYFRLHPHGQLMEGRWTGLSYDGPMVSGLGVLARSREEALSAMKRLVAAEGGRGGTDRRH